MATGGHGVIAEETARTHRPTRPVLLALGPDDRTVRVWAMPPVEADAGAVVGTVGEAGRPAGWDGA